MGSVYFNADETDALQEMLVGYDDAIDADDEEVKKQWTDEIIGVVRFKLLAEKYKSVRQSERKESDGDD